jgi:hypothetical protein
MASLVDRKDSQFWWIKFIDPKTDKRVFESTRFRKKDSLETKKARALEATWTAKEKNTSAVVATPTNSWAEWVPGFLKRHCRGRTYERYVLAWNWLFSYALVLGLRNSHDKSFPVGLVAGASVFVCDNLSFSGEVRLTRKHTTHLQRDLPQLVAGGVGKLMQLWMHQGQRIDAYKNHRMRDKSAHDLVIRAVDVGACTNRMTPSVIKEWREPSHIEFGERSACSLFNAFTEILKGNLPELPKRTEVLHALFDTTVGLPAAHLN